MRIALIDPSLLTLPYDRALAQGLARLGHAVTLHTRRLRPDERAGGVALATRFYPLSSHPAAQRLPRAPRLAIKGVEHVVGMARLAARLRRDPPDVIHFQWLPLPLLDRAFLPGLRRLAPLVLTVHDSTPFNGDPAAMLQRLRLERSYAAFDRLIVHTEGFRAQLIARGIAPERVARVPHGLLAEAQHAAAAEEAGADPLVFLLFGHIKPYKGADILLQAFALLPPALRARARLHVIGRPYMDLAPLSQLAQASGIADRLTLEPRFVPDDEIAALFGPATIAVFPYREIDASGAFTLALAHGRPIVASRIGAFAEQMRDGVHGALVPPGDPAALAAAMARLIEDRSLVARCAAQVRALGAAVPGWDEIAQRTTEVYAAAIAGAASCGAAERREASSRPGISPKNLSVAPRDRLPRAR